MQRCPYIYEMKERLLGEEQQHAEVASGTKKAPATEGRNVESKYTQQPVSTVVKVNLDGYGFHISPSHERNDRLSLTCNDSFRYNFDCHGRPKNAKTSLFIIMSFIYMKLLVVVCIAYVFADVITHNIPLWYYEGFFTYLYGVSILFLLYVFCFLLQESTCCSGGEEDEKLKIAAKERNAKEKERKIEEKAKKKEEKERKKEEKERLKKEKEEKKKEEEKDKGDAKKKDKKAQDKSTYRRNSEGVVDAGLAGVPVPIAELSLKAQSESSPAVPHPQESTTATATNNSQSSPPAPSHQDVEAGTDSVRDGKRKRKTTQSYQSYGSFFLRIGAIAFGLGTMIYNGLEFGTFFEIPITSPCYMLLRGVNPVLQMVFTFMQMYFIFMNSRLNIHKFKVIARFGLMHIMATNICVWIRTVILEYLKEITVYHTKINNTMSGFQGTIRDHTLRNAKSNLGSHMGVPDSMLTTTSTPSWVNYGKPGNLLQKLVTVATTTTSTARPTLRRAFASMTTNSDQLYRSVRGSPTPMHFVTSSTTKSSSTATTPASVQSTLTASTFKFTTESTQTTPGSVISTFASTPLNNLLSFNEGFDTFESQISNVAEDAFSNEVVEDIIGTEQTGINGSELLDSIFPQSWWASSYNASEHSNNSILQASCERINIMGTIVKDTAPYLYPFIIEYSLIGAVVIYVMWRHIGRNPKYYNEDDLEHRLEVMLSRRAVAMAHAQNNGRVDCVGASKGLFFGLLLLVGSLICLILFFVLIHHPNLNLLAIYLADVSHCAVMVLSILAIIIGFCRVRSLKFKIEDQSDLNDILLRISAFGLFTYATFSIIAGSLQAFTREPNFLVMVTGILSVVQVILQLLFIGDVSRRRVHLPEHDRSKPGRQIVTFLLICNITMWIIYTFETQKVEANPIQLNFYGFLTWALIQRITLPLCIFHRFHSAVTLAEIWKTSYKARLE